MLFSGQAIRITDGPLNSLADLLIGDHLLTTWPVITGRAFVMRHHGALFRDWLLHSGIEVVEFGLKEIPARRGSWESWRLAAREPPTVPAS